MVRIGRHVELQDVDGLFVIFQQRPLVRFDGKQELIRIVLGGDHVARAH